MNAVDLRRPDACPNPDNQRFTHCGAKVELTLEGPAKHDCQPECLICGENHFTGSAQCVGKFRKAWKPALTQRQHGLKNKQEEPSAPLRTDEKAKPMHNKPKPIKAPAGQKSRPPTFGAEDFPSLANPPKQTPPKPEEKRKSSSVEPCTVFREPTPSWLMLVC
ncbi:hypothetical protein HPB51_020429 [Rhipicephalus microplus]|uniref:Uncharacterized protein n=1 Tax=Rhipicephalus microplus TaxID=6941 RepID=A0A9J6DC23_RHIMP|nr:hypothetical protein HPB51_020429 [Rhipicephalus microplus]